jgi:hypothetical protein
MPDTDGQIPTILIDAEHRLGVGPAMPVGGPPGRPICIADTDP